MAEPERRFRVEFTDATKKELRKLGHTASVEILAAVDKKLTVDPEGYGERLRNDLKGYYKLVVGQWRVVYCIAKELVIVMVLAVGKRAEGDRENIYDQITRHDLDSRRAALDDARTETPPVRTEKPHPKKRGKR